MKTSLTIPFFFFFRSLTRDNGSGLFNLGFGWVEVGSVTPKPQVRNIPVHAAHTVGTHQDAHSRATRARAFSFFSKIPLLSTAMVSLRKDLSRFFHASVRASPPSPRQPKNTGRLCDKAGSSRSTLGRTKKVRKNHLTTLSRASMRSLLMPMCLSSMFRVLTPPAYGVLLYL